MMTKPLSERLEASTIETVRPLLEELRETMWEYHRDPDGIGFDKFNALLGIGPEGYLSAVAMLVPTPKNEFAEKFSVEEYQCDGVHKDGCLASAWVPGSPRVRGRNPAIALAAAIAKSLE